MYKLSSLPFNYQDLEPFIDTHTTGLHYNRHHKVYLDKLNALLKKNNFDFSYPIEQLYNHLNEFNPSDLDDILFNLGGVVNHNLYFLSINPNNKEKASGKLLEKIEEKFSTFDNFVQEFIKSALSLKGSGYTFLVKTPKDDIKIINTTNQVSPYLYGYTPLFTVDMWEHAYYINYDNNKPEYLDNFFKIANFSYANKNI